MKIVVCGVGFWGDDSDGGDDGDEEDDGEGRVERPATSRKARRRFQSWCNT